MSKNVIKEALAIFDYLTFKKTSQDYLRKDTKTEAGKRGMTKYAIPEWSSLTPGDKARYDAYKAKLKDYGSNKDLRKVLSEVDNDTSISNKVAVKEALVIFDYLTYKKASQDLLRPKTKTEAGKKGMTKYAIPEWPSLGSGDKAPYDKNKGKLTDHESNWDLKTVLCELNSSEKFCPAISEVKPNQAEQGKETEIKLTGNFSTYPEVPKVEFSRKDEDDNEVKDDKITVATDEDGKKKIKVSPDGKTIDLTIKVESEAVLTEGKNNKRTIMVSTPDGWLSAQAVDALSVVSGGPSVDSISPSKVWPGKENVTFTITGKNLGDVIKIRQNDLFPDVELESNNGTIVVFKPVTIRSNANLGSYEITLLGKGDQELAKVRIEVAKKPTILTPMQKAAYELQKKWGIEAKAQGGVGDFNNDPSKAPRQSQSAIRDNIPNGKFDVRVAPTILGKKGEGLIENDTVEVKANAHAGYQGHAHGSEFGEAGGGAKVKVNIADPVAAEAYGQYEFQNRDPEVPNEWLISGRSHKAKGGAAVEVDLEKTSLNLPLKAKVFGEYEHEWFKWYPKTLAASRFEGKNELVRTGAEVTLSLAKMHEGREDWRRILPDLTLFYAAIPWGRHEVPKWLPGGDSSSFESMTGHEVKVRADFKNIVDDKKAKKEERWNPYVVAGWKRTDISGWEPMEEAYGGGGVTIPGAVDIKAILGSRWNTALIEKVNNPFYAVFSFSPAEALGRWSALTLNVIYNQYESLRGNYQEIGGTLELDLLKVITGPAPEKEEYVDAQVYEEEEKTLPAAGNVAAPENAPNAVHVFTSTGQ
ncbi:hypothetical protein AMJ44_10055 [candidate division WOR-1 bacterium DG_54_3]|uniref:Uncharacterized protein n=1 Tax=candidate division WOR-1 bacterium DG_54_3 TaxID=1703775 RepID=A0A0S7XST8_UNCSA|nr:MAG: hypothetical protein AMJ44_10055 [candidate division WOR-1 bacterium DG_54_3]